MKKLIMIMTLIASFSVFAGPHGRPHIHHNPPKPRIHMSHRNQPPPPRCHIPIRVWIPEQRMISVNVFGVSIITVIPGHWIYR